MGWQRLQETGEMIGAISFKTLLRKEQDCKSNVHGPAHSSRLLRSGV